MKTKLLLLLLAFSFVSVAQESPNVLYIIVDQHSALTMNQSGYSHIASPGVDKLAEDGVVFTRSYCSYPVCTSSRKTFMTGAMPSKASDVTTHVSIGTQFKNNGYETVYYGKWHVGSTHMDDAGVEAWHGFDTYDEENEDTETYGYSSAFLKSDHEKPFFMMTSFLNPHDCCELARIIAGASDSYHDGAVEENADTALCPKLPSNFAIPPNEAEGFYARRNQDPEDQYWSSMPNMLWSEVEWRQYMYGYDRLVEKVDKHVENLYDDLVDAGLLDNTIIVYTSDHGDGHGSHAWTQKKSFYEESVNVPLIISWKGKTHKALIDKETLTSGLDIYPTILELAGITAPTGLAGKDLSPVLLTDAVDTVIERDYVVSEMNQKVYKGNTPGTFVGKTVITQNYKYILFDQGVNREQLFDIKNDPGELIPLTDNPDYQDIITESRNQLKEWVALIDDDFDVDAIIADFDGSAMLDAVLANNENIEGFDPQETDQALEVIMSDDVVFTATPVNSAASVSVVQPTNLAGNETERTVTITVTSEDELNSMIYKVLLDSLVVDSSNTSQINIGFDDTSVDVPLDEWTSNYVLISESIDGPGNHGLYDGDAALKFVRGQSDKTGYLNTSSYENLDTISFWLYVNEPDAATEASLKIEAVSLANATTELLTITDAELSETEWTEFKIAINTTESVQITFTPSLPTDGSTRLWMDDMTITFNATEDEAGDDDDDDSDETTGVSSNLSGNGILLFPNPCGDILNINNVESGTIIIYDITGEPMFNKYIETNAGAIDVSSLDSGIYIMEFRGTKVYTQRFIKK